MSALAGVRVLDLTRHIPGPYATLMMGDLGADVVKVEEPPLGDPTRAVPPGVGEDSALHAALNRNKRSIFVDLRRPEGAGLLRRLAARSDVLVEGFRPGVLERHGLGAETLLAENPRLVYCSLSGYGREGPLAGRAGHDVNYLARAGFLAGSAAEDGRPVLASAQLADMAGGLYALVAVLAALVCRERTGRGQHVEASLLGGAFGLMTVPLARLLAGGEARNELTGAYACYNVYRCRDGRYLSVGALEPRFWERLCEALGLPELVSRQWEGRAKRAETVARVARAFAEKDRDAWLAALAEADCCVEPVLEPAEAARLAGAGLMLDQPSGPASFRTVGAPFALLATPPAVRRPAPGPGEHTDEVLREAGLPPADVARLRGQGVVA